MSFDFSDFKMTFSRPLSPIVIAEIGTGHGGDIQKGLDLIDAAADSGAHIAKLQVVFAHEILPPEAGLVPLPGGNTPLYETFRALERPLSFYQRLSERAEERGIGFLATPFGEKSIKLLEEIGVKAWKVASPELNHEPLLQRVAAGGLPLILSTGVSRLSDIERALDVIAAASPTLPAAAAAAHPEIILLHCITNYPAPEHESNLRIISSLAAVFGYPVGLSDHSLHPVIIPALAAALGAVAIEKHFTLDNGAGGLDDPVALTPAAFAEMCAAVKHYAPPSSPKYPSAHEAHLAAVITEMSARYGSDRIQAILGDGIKRPAASELPHYGRTNRSLHAVGALAAGTVLNENNTAILRTEKVLSPGVAPRYRELFYGRRLKNAIAAGDGINWSDIL